MVILLGWTCRRGSPPSERETTPVEVERWLQAEPPMPPPQWVPWPRRGPYQANNDEAAAKWAQAYVEWMYEARKIPNLSAHLGRMLAAERDPKRRARLVRALVPGGDVESGPQLVQIASSPSEDASVRSEAIMALPNYAVRRHGKEVARRAIIVLRQISMWKSETSELRNLAVAVSPSFGDRSIIPFLGKLLSDDDEDLRVDVCQALAFFAPEHAEAMALLRKALDDDSEKVRMSAAGWLDDLKDRSN
jgi:hypothetical protein